MKVGVIGSGGREHAICISLKKSKNIDKIYCFPGNAGTSFIAENIEVELNNFEELKRVIKELGIDIIIVGPEKPLVDGIVDFLKQNKSIWSRSCFFTAWRFKDFHKKFM